jgi:hypothetical protein
MRLVMKLTDRLAMWGERLVRFLLICKDANSTSAEKSYLAALLAANREVEML